MARVNDQILDGVVYLYESEEDASNGENWGGSGFLLGVAHHTPEPLLSKPLKPAEFTRQWTPSWDYGFHVYVVTAKHVVAPSGGTPCTFVRVNTRAGGTDTLEIPSGLWHSHPYGADVAVAPIQLSFEHQATWVPISMVLTEFLDDLLDVGPGDDVVIAGRFISIEGKQQNQPALRFGSVSMRPGESIRTSPQDPGQESFLVECHSKAGFSGAPVFLDVRSWELPQQSLRQVVGHLLGQQLWLLLGVDWGHIHDVEKVREPDGTEHGKLQVRTNTGMMAVVPAWKVVEILQQPELIDQRKEEREAYERQRRIAAHSFSREPEDEGSEN